MTYNPLDIFTQTDLSKLTKSGIINGDIIVRGEHLAVLNGVKKINGFLGPWKISLLLTALKDFSKKWLKQMIIYFC